MAWLCLGHQDLRPKNSMEKQMVWDREGEKEELKDAVRVVVARS